MLSDRLVQIVWECCDGNFETLRTLVEASGGTVQEESDHVVVRNTYGMTVGLARDSDPITTLVQICFALFGQWWHLLPSVARANEIVNKQWKERVRSEQKKARGG